MSFMMVCNNKHKTAAVSIQNQRRRIAKGVNEFRGALVLCRHNANIMWPGVQKHDDINNINPAQQNTAAMEGV